jgi:hypothetical protein
MQNGLIGAFPFSSLVSVSRKRSSTPRATTNTDLEKIFMLTVGKGCFNLVTSDLQKNMEMFRQSTLGSGKSLNVLLVR